LLEDEQEIELEQEQEQEREVYRPKKVQPCLPELENDVVNFMLNGQFNQNSDCFIHLPKSYSKTSLCDKMQENAWSKNLYVTKDFFRTVQFLKDDDYLKFRDGLYHQLKIL
jgi:hypothetical protein